MSKKIQLIAIACLCTLLLGLVLTIVNTDPPLPTEPASDLLITAEPQTYHTLANETADLSQHTTFEDLPNTQLTTDAKSHTNDISPLESLIQTKNDKVILDHLGNYVVDVTIPGSSSYDHLVSNSPIRFATAEELQYGIQGCASASYIFEYMASFAFIVDNAEGRKIYHYTCEYDADHDQYRIVSSDSNSVPIHMDSINNINNKHSAQP